MNRSRLDIPKRGDPIAPEFFRSIADCTVDWESWLSCDGKVVWVNDAVQQFTGYAPAECLAMADYPLEADDFRSRPWKPLKTAGRHRLLAH